MNWIAQMGHVAAKDARHARWPLAAYLLLSSITAASVVTGRAFGPYWTSSTVEVLGMMDLFVIYLPVCVVVLGFVLTASLLQTDSPTRATAFWASRPLSPSAVLTSKLAFTMLAILVVPLLAGAVVLRSLDASGFATARLMAGTGFAYGEWLMAAMIVAALTDDLRAFITSFIAIVGVTVVLADSLQDMGPSHGLLVPLVPLVPLVLTCVGVVGGVGLLVFLYRTRDKRLPTRIAGAVAAVCLVCVSFRTSFAGDVAAPVVSSGPRLELEPIDPAGWGSARELRMRVRAASGASTRLDFQADTMRIATRGGSVVHANGPWTAPATLARVLPSLGTPVRWIADEPDAAWPGTLVADVNELDRKALSTRAQSVMVGGTVTVSRSHVVASMPLRDGAVLVRDGRRVSIYGLSYGPTGADVWLQISALPRVGEALVPQSWLRNTGGLQFAIVNDARSEALLLHSTSSESVSGGSGAIVLPWMDVSTTFMRFTTNTSPDASARMPRDNAWYATARLVVVAWTPAETYRTSVQVTPP